MKLRRAYYQEIDGPAIVFEFDRGGPAYWDLYQKTHFPEAGFVLLEALDPEHRPLEGFESLEIQAVNGDPTSRHEFAATPNSAPTRDPLVVMLAREFREAANSFTFRAGEQVFPAVR